MSRLRLYEDVETIKVRSIDFNNNDDISNIIRSIDNISIYNRLLKYHHLRYVIALVILFMLVAVSGLILIVMKHTDTGFGIGVFGLVLAIITILVYNVIHLKEIEEISNDKKRILVDCKVLIQFNLILSNEAINLKDLSHMDLRIFFLDDPEHNRTIVINWKTSCEKGLKSVLEKYYFK